MNFKKLKNTLVSKKILLKPREKVPEQINMGYCISENHLINKDYRKFRTISMENLQQSLPVIPQKYMIRSPEKIINHYCRKNMKNSTIETIRQARQESLSYEYKSLNQKRNKLKTTITQSTQDSLIVSKIDQTKRKDQYSQVDIILLQLDLDNVENSSFGGWKSKSSQSIVNELNDSQLLNN